MRRRAHSRHSRENERVRRAARSRIARMHVIAHALAKNVPSDRYLQLADSLHTPFTTGCRMRSSLSSPLPTLGKCPLPLDCAVTWTIPSDDSFKWEQNAQLSSSESIFADRDDLVGTVSDIRWSRSLSFIGRHGDV